MRPVVRLVLAALHAVVIVAAMHAADAARKHYRLPEGDATDTLRQFAQQADCEIMFSADAVAGVKTNAVSGDSTPCATLDLMLAGTPLRVKQDATTGALAVVRDIPTENLADRKGGVKTAQSTSATANPDAERMIARPASDREEDVVLSPFLVNAESEKDRYQATSTLAGTRVRTELKNVASSISVVTSQFLKDTGATNNETLLVYTTNTEVGGVYGNYGAVGVTFTEGGGEANLVHPHVNTRIRGLDSADNTRDFFLTDIPWDSFNVGRIDIQRGPNSILFGIGSPAGIINSSVNTAVFKNASVFENRLGSFGTVRDSLDLNHVLLDKQLAIRITLLDDHTQYRQQPANSHDKRAFGAVQWNPRFFNSDSAHTGIRFNFERGDVKANRPRILPPTDSITPFFDPDTVNKTAWDSYYAWTAGIMPSGTTKTLATEKVDPWLNQNYGGNYVAANPMFYYDNLAASPSTALYVHQGPPAGSHAGRFAIGPTGAYDNQINGLPFGSRIGIGNYNQYTITANLYDKTLFPGALSGFYKSEVITDPTTFDFYNNLIDGPNKREWQNWTAYNLSLEQTFLNSRLGFQFVYDRQQYDDAGESNGSPFLSVDLNANLPTSLPWAYGSVVKYNGTGAAGTNQNAGRAYIGGSNGGGYSIGTDRESFRLTATGELRATDFMNRSLISDVLGRHILTGLYSRDAFDRETRGWNRFGMSVEWDDTLGAGPGIDGSGSMDIKDLSRAVGWLNYVSAPLFNASSAAGLHIQPLTAVIAPSGATNIQYFDSHWKWSLVPGDPGYVDPAAAWTNPTAINPPGSSQVSTQSENPANYAGWTTGTFKILNADQGDIDSLYTSAAKLRQVNISAGLTWQAFLWDDMIAGTYGWRRDTQSQRSGNGTISTATKAVGTSFGLTSDETKVVGDSRSWGVVLHEPKALRNKLPLGTNLSLIYNEGSNCRVENRYNFTGDPLPNAKGLTKEYGVAISMLNDRLQLKTIWYETTMQDANLSSTLSSQSTLGAYSYYSHYLPAWGLGNVLQAIAGMNGDPLVANSAFRWNYAAKDTPNVTALNNVTSAEFLNHPSTIAEKAAITAFLENMPPQSWWNAYGYGVNVAQAKARNYQTAITGWTVNMAITSIRPTGAGTINGVAPTGTVDNKSKGVEFEVVGQLMKNWNVSINASKTHASQTKLGAPLIEYMDTMQAFYGTAAGDIRLWSAGDQSIGKYFDQNVGAAYRFQAQTNGKLVPEMSPWRANLVTNYIVSDGLLRGFNVGLGHRWQQGQILGYALNSAQTNLDVNKPYWGKSQASTDLWIGYRRKLGPRIDWHIQLNARSVGQKASLIPLSVQPDGSIALYRIREGQTWTLTNTFSF
ncbi:MAG: TonB-dependent receptor plug domain-containing protein [Opitutaceae bacterium]|jgi:outer membrane receptor protein involved in Fe transport